MKFRYLTADDVDARVSQVLLEREDPGIMVLLYKDARCDMRILDETVGPENWQREHYECKGNLFCRVGINVNYNRQDWDPHWVWKSDCGTESNTEAQKGEASDSFKRACFNWGIGRELYTSPPIWIPQRGKDGKPNFEVKPGNRGKMYPRLRLRVSEMTVQDGKITYLVVKNFQRIVFTWREQ